VSDARREGGREGQKQKEKKKEKGAQWRYEPLWLASLLLPFLPPFLPSPSLVVVRLMQVRPTLFAWLLPRALLLLARQQQNEQL